MTLFISPALAAASSAWAAARKSFAFLRNSPCCFQISGFARVLPTSGPVPAGNNDGIFAAVEAMIAVWARTELTSGGVASRPRCNCFIALPRPSIASWRSCMIFSAWSLLGAAASITMLLVAALAFAVGGGEAELLIFAWVLLAWLVSGPPQPERNAAAALAV